jgi:hypothetical protein
MKATPPTPSPPCAREWRSASAGRRERGRVEAPPGLTFSLILILSKERERVDFGFGRRPGEGVSRTGRDALPSPLGCRQGSAVAREAGRRLNANLSR